MHINNALHVPCPGKPDVVKNAATQERRRAVSFPVLGLVEHDESADTWPLRMLGLVKR